MRQAIAAQTKDRATVLQIGLNILSDEPSVALEYLEIVDPSILVSVDIIAPGTLIAIAAKVGKTRLTDNFLA